MGQGYKGFKIPLTFGPLGIQSDLSQPTEPPFSLLLGENVNVRYGGVSKCPGSQRWNYAAVDHTNSPNLPSPSPLPGAVIQIFDWWPDPETQRLIVCCADGNVYKFNNPYEYIKVVSSDGTANTLTFSNNTVIVAGGAELANYPRKLFIFSGNNPIQVISGDSDTRHSLVLPALDWATYSTMPTTVGGVTSGTVKQWNYYPTTGIIYNGSLWVAGNQNNPHTVYQSNSENHEDFVTTGAITFTNVYPGEFEKVIALFSWKTRLYVGKYPKGLYYIDTSNPSAPIPDRIGDSFGFVGPLCQSQALDNMYIGTTSGGVTSLTAVFSLGQTEQGDIFKQIGCSQFIRDNTAQGAAFNRQMVYYEDKKQIITSYSSTGFTNDTLVIIDMSGNNPCVTTYKKDNPNCLGLIKDYEFVPRPYYGANDGYIYSLDSPIKAVGYYDPSGTLPYSETEQGYLSRFQTPHLDFNWIFVGLQNTLQEIDKHFDHLGITYESRGNWPLFADIFVDGRYKDTLTFNLSRGTFLDGAFPLDQALLQGTNPTSNIQPVSATGKRISVRFYSDGAGQDFRIISAVFYVRPGGQNNLTG